MFRWLKNLFIRERLVKAPIVSCTYRVYREKTDSWEPEQHAIVSARDFIESKVST